MSIRGTIEWCEKQGDASLNEIADVLERSPNAKGQAVLRLLWDEATGDKGMEPLQSAENVEKFYRRFPALPGLRPLMFCDSVDARCLSPLVNFTGLITHRAVVHNVAEMNTPTPIHKPVTMKLEPGKVYTLALQYTTGKQSQYNQTQTMFSLTSGDRLIVPYQTAREIEQLGLAQREAFQIVRYGNNTWKVRKAPGALRVDPEMVEKEGPQNDAAQRFDTTEITESNNPTTPRKPVGIEQYAITPATQLEHALKTALQAASNAEKYATQIGYTCRFTPEAIKSMAITLLINGANGRAA